MRDGAGLGPAAAVPVFPPEEHAAPVPAPAAPVRPAAQAEEAQTSLLPDAERTVPWRLAGEVLSTYIIVERGDEVLFIDKHAAHERLHFDRLRAEGYAPMGQRLLTPLLLRRAAGTARRFSKSSRCFLPAALRSRSSEAVFLAVRQVPADVSPEAAEDALLELAAFLTDGGRPDTAAARDALLASVACKASVRGGEKSEARELAVLAEAVMEGRVRHCPHGRPVAVVLTKKELERRFGRA